MPPAIEIVLVLFGPFVTAGAGDYAYKLRLAGESGFHAPCMGALVAFAGLLAIVAPFVIQAMFHMLKTRPDQAVNRSQTNPASTACPDPR